MTIQKIIEMLEKKKEIYVDGITAYDYQEEMNFLIELLEPYIAEDEE